MRAQSEPSGKSADGTVLEPLAFIKAFIAGLVTRDLDEIYPHEPATRRGSSAVIDSLDTRAAELARSSVTRPLARQTILLSNALRASNTGAFDGFETVLRQAQLTFTSSPNPKYDEIAFSVSRPYAQSLIEELGPSDRRLIDGAVEQFVAAFKGATNGLGQTARAARSMAS